MAFAEFGQASSQLLVRIEQSIDVQNRKISDLQSKISNLTTIKAILQRYLEEAIYMESRKVVQEQAWAWG